MKKRYLIAVALSTYFIATPAQALPCDSRGSNWQGSVQIGAAYYNIELRRQTCAAGSLWNFYLRPTSGGGAASQGQVTVSLSGRSLNVSPVPGTATGCPITLNGTYARRDVTNGRPTRGSGTATCGGTAPTGVWRAAIR
ncbi:MAG: hypothetical protein ABJN65_15030 [Parasphingorhabdus sp.]